MSHCVFIVTKTYLLSFLKTDKINRTLIFGCVKGVTIMLASVLFLKHCFTLMVLCTVPQCQGLFGILEKMLQCTFGLANYSIAVINVPNINSFRIISLKICIC